MVTKRQQEWLTLRKIDSKSKTVTKIKTLYSDKKANSSGTYNNYKYAPNIRVFNI